MEEQMDINDLEGLICRESNAKYFIEVKRATVSNKLHNEIQRWVKSTFDRKIAGDFESIYKAITDQVGKFNRANPRCKPVSVSKAVERAYTNYGEIFYMPNHIWITDRNFELGVTIILIDGVYE